MSNCALITHVLTSIVVILEAPDQLLHHVGVLCCIGVDLALATDQLVRVALPEAKQGQQVQRWKQDDLRKIVNVYLDP